METVSIGTVLRTSALGLGCMEFGTRIPANRAFAVLDAYYDEGGRFIDTSNNYAFWALGGKGGESEEVIGAWLRERGCRDEMVIATKVGAQPTEPGAGLEKAEGLGAATIAAACEASLSRLGLDEIDLYYAHIDDEATPLEETLFAFEQLRQRGLVRETACSNYSVDRFKAARATSLAKGWQPYAAIQQRHSLLTPNADHDLGLQRTLDERLRAELRTSGIPLIAYSALLGGSYDNGVLPPGYQSERNAQVLSAVRETAIEMETTPNEIVLAALLDSSFPIVPLIASSDPDRIRKLMKAAVLKLSEDKVRLLTAGC